VKVIIIEGVNPQNHFTARVPGRIRPRARSLPHIWEFRVFSGPLSEAARSETRQLPLRKPIAAHYGTIAESWCVAEKLPYLAPSTPASPTGQSFQSHRRTAPRLFPHSSARGTLLCTWAMSTFAGHSDLHACRRGQVKCSLDGFALPALEYHFAWSSSKSMCARPRVLCSSSSVTI